MSDNKDCRQAFDDFYHKIKAEVSYDHWCAIWRFIRGRQVRGNADASANSGEPVKVLSEEIIEAVKAYGLAYSTPNTTATELTIRLQDIRALLALQSKDREDVTFLQDDDQHDLHRFIETTEDGQGYDIGKDRIKRLAELGVVSNEGFGRYSVTMFGHWCHERYRHQNPSLPLKTIDEHNAEPVSSDRQMLLKLMEAFDTEMWQCPSCGYAEDTATMDSAYMLRDYLKDATVAEPVKVPSDYWRERVDEIANNIGEALSASDNQLLVDDISVYVTQLFELARYGNAAPEQKEQP